MQSRRALFVVRAVLALALLWMAAPASGAGEELRSRAEIVVVARPSHPAAQGDDVRRARAASARPRAPSAPAWPWAVARPHAPTLGPDTPVLVEDLYLRHLAILC